MGGILFLKSKNVEKIKEFYQIQIGMDAWLEQEDCVILKHGNLLLGFCAREEIEKQGIITFFYPTREEVDSMYAKLWECATTELKENDKYQIYHFFAKDPENRTIEFQSFLHPMDSYLTGDEMLIKRRSIRYFGEREVHDDVLRKLFEVCRYAPTSKNSQSYYFLAVYDKKKLGILASLRKKSSAPIARAPLAVAICSDPSKSKRHIQDGCIAAYHFLLAAWNFELGTCWIGGMDRDDVKETLGIPQNHYVATVTPLGHPAEQPEPRSRRPSKEMVKFIK